MSSWQAEALDPGSGELVHRPWPKGSALRLRAAPGAAAVQVRWLEDGAPVALLEVPAGSGEVVTLELDTSGLPRAGAPGSPVFRLPADTPAAMPRRSIESPALDLALVIDATRLHLQEVEGEALPVAVPMLADREAWAAECRGLTRAMAELAEGARDLRFSVLVFGDQPAPFPVAEDLRPAFDLEPPIGDRRFASFSSAALERRLGALRPSPGGDAVDAVAEGLLAAAGLPWRADARRLALLIGDSPGYSIEDQAPSGAVSHARRESLESAAAGVFAQSIDLATFFVPPDPDLVVADTWRSLLLYAERHYRRLASIPEWAFVPGKAGLGGLGSLRALVEPPRWLARGPSLGFFV
ncbi:MAG: hypothetical protein MI919_20930 [Holophagales bacterium]|nr:hypothetical protein [Holophagales bacterium]